MTRRIMFGVVAVCVLAGFLGASPLAALTVGGVVRQPLNLTSEDLAKFESTTVRLNELTRDNRFRGAFTYRGVPLKTLLELATIRKEESGYQKPFDLAVLVRNKEGKTTVLSWGEIFYRNPSDILVAFSSVPVMPLHDNCVRCHGAKVYQPALDQLKRKVGFPKLVVTGDFFTDRSIEDVVSIDVVEMKKKADKRQMKTLVSPKFSVIDEKGKATEVSEIKSRRRIEVSDKNVGEGLGYHGSRRLEGVPLREILKKTGMAQDTDLAVLASSVDGYRVLVSYGEVFLAPAGERILVADSANGVPLKEGKFALVFPDDTAAERTVKALSRIEIVSLKEKPKLYVIGMGCADSSLITLEAISHMGKADVFIVADDLRKRFSKYIGDKPVLFDPMGGISHVLKKDKPWVTDAREREKLEMERVKNKQKIRDALKAGKNVALLEYGDPTIYAPWQHWFDDDLRRQVEIVPGMSAFNVSNAMIGGNLACRGGSFVVSTPGTLTRNEETLKAVAAKGDTVAIFMGVRELKTLQPLLLKHYPASTPVRIVYKAGYSNSKHLVRTTVGEVLAAAEKEKEKHLAMIYIGPCLE